MLRLARLARPNALAAVRLAATTRGASYATKSALVHRKFVQTTLLPSTGVLAQQTTLISASEWRSVRFYSSGEEMTIETPSMGDSISEGTIVQWMKQPGEHCDEDEVILQIETDKVTVDVRAPKAGKLTKHLANEGDNVEVGQPLANLVPGAGGSSSSAAAAPEAQEKDSASESNEKKESSSGATKGGVGGAPPPPPPPPPKDAKKKESPAKEAPSKPKPPPQAPSGGIVAAQGENRKPMSRMRRRIAENMKNAQNTAAMLTTFQECNMFNLKKMREQYKDAFLKKHDVKLGFMSAFVKASTMALKDVPMVNNVIDGTDIIERSNIDISVAVATPTGLVVPVLRGCDALSFADVERNIAYLGERARTGKLTMEDMTGGTFTISNGGVYGSLMGTPIINMPQSAVLGMHGIFDRPVAENGEVKIRPMMMLALTYDHRIIDGREAVTFLKRVKECIEDPQRLLLEV